MSRTARQRGRIRRADPRFLLLLSALGFVHPLFAHSNPLRKILAGIEKHGFLWYASFINIKRILTGIYTFIKLGGLDYEKANTCSLGGTLYGVGVAAGECARRRGTN